MLFALPSRIHSQIASMFLFSLLLSLSGAFGFFGVHGANVIVGARSGSASALSMVSIFSGRSYSILLLTLITIL